MEENVFFMEETMTFSNVLVNTSDHRLKTGAHFFRFTNARILAFLLR